jgi:hypothetical protein
MRRAASPEAPLPSHPLQPPLAAPSAAGASAQQQEAQQLAQAWLQAVATHPMASANMRAALGAGAAQAAAVGSDLRVAQEHLVAALVRAIVEVQVGVLANTAAAWRASLDSSEGRHPVCYQDSGWSGALEIAEDCAEDHCAALLWQALQYDWQPSHGAHILHPCGRCIG